MGTFNDGDSGSSIRTKLNTAIQKTEGTSAISTIDVDGGAIDGVTLGTNSAVTEAQVDNININGNTISSTNTNGDVTIDPNGTGDVNVGNFKFDADQTVGAGQDNYVLTYDNSGGKISLEAASGGGGGDPDLYRDNDVSATTPSAAGDNSVAIGSNASTASGNTGTHSIAIGRDAFARNQFNVAIGRGAEAGNSVNTGSYSGAFGHNSLAYKQRSIALGTSRSGGDDSFAASITNNTSSYGATSVYSVAIGYLNKASGPWSFAAGGLNNIASQSASIAMGNGNTASGERSFSLGASNIASGYSSFAHGSNSKAAERGKKSFASGQFSAVGDAQGGQFILRVSTTDATPTVLTADNGSGLNNSQIIAANDTCITFDGTITAMQNGAQSYASWRIEGLLVNDGGTTTLANSAITVIQNSSSWGMALSADNTNNALSITGTGEASHNIRWVANIRTTEVTYA